jgi:predicted GH43/DUF377 family glycosyl hydrolase
MKLKRYDGNPILTPRDNDWERMQVRNPAAWYDGEVVHMLYSARAVYNTIYLGYATSADGFHFDRVGDGPWMAPPEGDEFDSGTVEDARIVRIDGVYYVTYMARAIGKDDFAAGKRLPSRPDTPTWQQNWRRAGLLTTKDFTSTERLGPITSDEVFDANVLLFPEKIGGRFAMIHRPSDFVCGTIACLSLPWEERLGMRICFSDDLVNWVDDRPLARPAYEWENVKIGGSSPPIRTDAGWLTLYHGVQGWGEDDFVYRVGLMLLDGDDPTKVIARCPDPILEPEEPWEREGTVPKVVFPNAAVVIDGEVFVYYGGADTVVGVATAPLAELVDAVLAHPWPAD